MCIQASNNLDFIPCYIALDWINYIPIFIFDDRLSGPKLALGRQ